ncbi:MAG: YbaK/EbsC family protein [Clostridia bacterium]|nr:YbaK/EbsC family protein [Clostridia bacterium]
MSIEKVRAQFEAFGIAERMLEFPVSSATVELAAKALGTEGARIAKTLSFYRGDSCILVVTAGDMKVDNAKFKARFAMKAKMLSPDDALSMTGHAVGGVCPFALPEGVAVFLDVSLQRFETVFPAVGSANSAIEFTCAELAQYSGGEWVDVCKPIGG